jgi:CheY-like chemotaxis protein
MESIGQLTGGIAHDFNNMLAIVTGSLDLAKRRLKGSEDPKVAACIDNAAEGARRAAVLTGRLLAFSRQQPLEPLALDLNKLVGGMSEMLRRTIGEQVQVETVLAGGLWRAFADAAQLENAVLNLAINARDAMPGGGKLTIETANTHLDDNYARANPGTEPGQYVALCVSDSGVGMGADVAERAFDPFFTTKEVGQGTGLGLSQVFGYVKQSGGHVKIYSEVGEGTTVKLYLPRHLGSEAAAGAALAPDELPAGGPDTIVLVVEDEEAVRFMTVDALRELGYTVLHAADAAEALALAEQQPRLDLLFTDIVMPGMNGRQLADRLREQRPNLVVLYTTGYTRNAVVHNGMLDAGVAFLPKPFTIEQLARKVAEVLAGAGVNRLET